ncbi:MAG TPA: hypothetical protein VF466_05100 [Candidatus Saccharimonadales bacterium]
MKYIVATVDGDTADIEAITSDPTGYVSDIEPIDVIKGNKIAWDERGTLYHFGPDKDLGVSRILRVPVAVDVGKWDFEAGEPFLVKVAEGQADQLKAALLGFLEAEHSGEAKRSGRLRKAEAESHTSLVDSDTPLDQLIDRVEETLNKN